MNKTAILIGFGGMGKRYYKALKLMKFNIIAICEKKKINFINYKFENNLKLTNNYKKLLNMHADLLCVASNTKSRFKILDSFCKKSSIKKIITEKPLSVSYKDSLAINKIAKKKKVRLIVNTHRSFSPNFLMVKNLFKKHKEKPSTIFINSPSAGLGNMGSTFFDLGFYFFNEKAQSISGDIDKTGTINPRGKVFKDPGGHGTIYFKNNKKLFFNLSENTGLPYNILVKSENLEVSIDEINNNFIFKKRPSKMKSKPLFFYLFKPLTTKMKLKHKFNVVKMTSFSIKKIFESKFSYQNINNAIQVMGCIFGVHISGKERKTIKLPLNKKYHNLKINFA